MPIYEYECKECGHVADILQKLTDPPVSICPKCDRVALVKVISPCGARLKGLGFYKNSFNDWS